MTPERRARRVRPFIPAALVAAAALVVAAAALAMAGAAVASESPAPGASAGPGASGGTSISIVKTVFQPADVTIHAGDSVTWTVTEAIGAPHSVTSGTPNDAKPGTAFDSGIGLRQNGDSFSFTFATAGTYPYFCAVHPDTMTGTVTVLEAGAGGSAEQASVDGSARLIAAGVLAIALVILFGWARLYRRLNPAP